MTVVVPPHCLPPGFADHLDGPAGPAVRARPAASLVLLRDDRGRGPEALLMRRSPTSGFVPGAYVFPGGCLDERDASFARRLGGTAPGAAADPLAPYRVAAVRELFEETGVLLAAPAPAAGSSDGADAADAADAARMAAARERLLAGRAGLAELPGAERLRLSPGDLVYAAHWITPDAEPRRYDTRFFLAQLPAGGDVRPDPREMTDAVWLTPGEALARFHAGALPMIFPTVRVLESLGGLPRVADLLASFRGRAVRTVRPRLVRAADGVGIVED